MALVLVYQKISESTSNLAAFRCAAVEVEAVMKPSDYLVLQGNVSGQATNLELQNYYSSAHRQKICYQ